MEWGREIAVNGVRPAWLADREQVRIGWRCGDGVNLSSPGAWNAQQVTEDTYEGRTWKNVLLIRLPAGHFAYKALDAGFEPWGGGDAAPTDWDGGEVLHSDASVSRALPNQWKWGWNYNPTRVAGDIIGYRKKVDPAAPPSPVVFVGQYDGHSIYTTPDSVDHVASIMRQASERPVAEDRSDTVTIRRMTESEVKYLAASHGHNFLRVFDNLGIIRADPTPLDRFMAAHPDADRRTAELALGWEAA